MRLQICTIKQQLRDTKLFDQLFSTIQLPPPQIGFFKRKRPGQTPDDAAEDLEGQAEGDEATPFQSTEPEPEDEAARTTTAEVEAGAGGDSDGDGDGGSF